MTEEKEKLKTDWEGKQPEETNFKKPVGIPDGIQEMKLEEIEEKQTTTWATKDLPEQQQVKQTQFLFKFIHGKGEEIQIVPYFVAPIIKKGGWKSRTGKVASNSKMYDLIVNLDLKKRVIDFNFGLVEDLKKFLEENLVGHKIKVFIETQNENTDEEFSKITKIPKQE